MNKLLNIKEIFSASLNGINLPQISIFIALMSLFFAIGGDSTKCISASECGVGTTTEHFSNDISLSSGSAYKTTIVSSANTTDKTVTLPNQSTTLLGLPSSSTAGDIVQINSGNNALTSTATISSSKITDGGTVGQVLLSDGSTSDGSVGLAFGSLAIANITDGGVAGQFIKSSGSALTYGKLNPLSASEIDISGANAGDVLQINQAGTQLAWTPISGGGGSFTATASQNVVAGTVGLESNGQVRNITVQQSGSNGVQISNATASSQPVSYSQWTFYNSNIDGQVIVFKDYDSANTSTCDTHIYVDVIEYSSGTLGNWGKQCLSNDWSTIANSYTVSNSTNLGANGQGHMNARRYGEESDETLNNYVVVFKGDSAQDGQIWAVPFSVNPSTSTITLGTYGLIHDENTCYSNGSCSSNNTAMDIAYIQDMAFASGQDDKMYIWWNIYHNNSWNANSYETSHKGFSCTSFGSSSANCSPTNNHKYTSQTTYFKQYSQGNNTEIVWDKTAQVFIGFDQWANYDCRFAQFRLHEGVYNSMSMGTYGSSADQVWYNGTPVTDQGGNNLNVTLPVSCANTNYSEAVYDSNADAWQFPVSAGSSYNNYDTIQTVWISVSADAVNLSSKPIVHGYSSFNSALGINSGGNMCQTAPNLKCKGENWTHVGNHYFDTTANKHYVYHRKIQQEATSNDCNDGYSTRCLAVYEFEIDPTTKLIDDTTFKEYIYQPVGVDSTYNQVWNFRTFIYKDKADNLLVAGYHHGASPSTPSQAYQYMAKAFVIPDNISDYIGYVTQGANSGATVTVYSIGAVIDGLTGLTIGSEYYVKADGSLGTSGTYKIGRAIATDKIYITGTR